LKKFIQKLDGAYYKKDLFGKKFFLRYARKSIYTKNQIAPLG